MNNFLKARQFCLYSRGVTQGIRVTTAKSELGEPIQMIFPSDAFLIPESVCKGIRRIRHAEQTDIMATIRTSLGFSWSYISVLRRRIMKSSRASLRLWPGFTNSQPVLLFWRSRVQRQMYRNNKLLLIYHRLCTVLNQFLTLKCICYRQSI